jgi:hypothetical protein
LKLDQNTGTKIYHQPSSDITNCNVVPRKKARMDNVGQDTSQRKTVAVPPCAAATTTISVSNYQVIFLNIIKLIVYVLLDYQVIFFLCFLQKKNSFCVQLSK